MSELTSRFLKFYDSGDEKTEGKEISRLRMQAMPIARSTEDFLVRLQTNQALLKQIDRQSAH